MSKRVFTVAPGPVTGSYEFMAKRSIRDGDIVTFKYPNGTSKHLVAKGSRKGRLCVDCPFCNHLRPGVLIVCGMRRVTAAGRTHRACEMRTPYYADHTMLQWFDVDNLMEEL
jgi:hypothetical protein